MSLSIRVSISRQTLSLFKDDGLIKRYSISTARKGGGEKAGSEQTPRGRHIIRAKIGADAALNTVFVGRRATGETYSPDLEDEFPDRDWILTRILWLSGTEPGRNRLGDVDTMRRYIYIHGCPDGCQIGRPDSHGCIRMRNTDVVDLFDRVPVGTPVIISE